VKDIFLNQMSFSFTKYLLIILIVPAIQQSSVAQCCSPGNPVSGSEYVGILHWKTLSTISYYRHSYSDTYFEGEEISD